MPLSLGTLSTPVWVAAAACSLLMRINDSFEPHSGEQLVWNESAMHVPQCSMETSDFYPVKVYFDDHVNCVETGSHPFSPESGTPLCPFGSFDSLDFLISSLLSC